MILQEYFTQMEDNTAFLSSVTTDKTKMIGVANLVIRKMYRKLDLKSEQIEFPIPITTVAAVDTYYIDARVRTITNMRTSTNHYLSFMDREEYERKYPYPQTTDSGEPEIYIPLEKVRIQTQPTSASTITLITDSASDTAVYAVVKGIVSGVLKSERLLLAVSPGVTSSNSYTSLVSITKDTTVGTVTATSNSAAVTNITLLPADTDKEFWKVRLGPKIPDDVYIIYYTGHTLPWMLAYDEDVIQIPDLWIDVFLDECTKRLLWKQGDKRSVEYAQIAGDELKDLDDSNMASEESDSTFGFPELDYTYNQGR